MNAQLTAQPVRAGHPPRAAGGGMNGPPPGRTSPRSDRAVSQRATLPLVGAKALVRGNPRSAQYFPPSGGAHTARCALPKGESHEH
jgi:hypothetical protein